MKSKMVKSSLCLTCWFLLVGGAPALAQSIFLEPNSIPAVHLEALRPAHSEVNFTNPSFGYFLSARFKTGENFGLKFELPVMHYAVQDYQGYSAESRTGVGNPYLGVEVGSARTGIQGEFGFRIPVVDRDNEAAQMGMLVDPVERLEAFTRDFLPIYAGLSYRYRSDNGLALMLRGVPVLWAYIGDGSSDNEIFLLHSAQIWYETEKVGVGAGFSGRLLATGDASGFGDRTLYQFGFFANYQFGNFMPGFQMRFPLDKDLKDSGLSPSYSLSVGLAI